MLYELHVTVDRHAGADHMAKHWQEHCGGNGSKPLLIQLLHSPSVSSLPDHSVQMMNADRFEGTDEQADEWVEDCLGLAEPFDVVRSKLEVPLDKGVGVYPLSRVEYHECHVKILTDPERAKWATDIAASFGWVVSRNLYLPAIAGMEKWYLTQRRYNVSGLDAAHDFHLAWAQIAPNMPPAARMEMETVINDTNPGLDSGWA